MASLTGAYDPDAALPSDRDPIPAGNYSIELTESDVVPTKNGKGQLFKYTAKVLEGEHEGRSIWGQMNLQNENAIAQEIGQGEFAALRQMTGVPNPEDTQDLHFKAFTAVVIVEPAKGEYKAKNAIKWAATIKLAEGGNDNAPPAEKAPATKTKEETKPATAKRPWAKKAA